ncbi:MAG: dihydroneopterin aldolase [Saprospiraceae bacterium]|nr:dihydroneopterin aldolase [Saprospiraceae bacterium]
MKTKVGIEGAAFYAFHGYYEAERKAGNEFILNAEVILDSFDSYDDTIDNTVNYEHMYKICRDEMAIPQQLLENVVFNILQRFKNEFSNINSAVVRLEKLGPQLGGKVKKSIVEMEYIVKN